MVAFGGGLTGHISDEVARKLAKAEFKARQDYENDPRNRGVYRRFLEYFRK